MNKHITIIDSTLRDGSHAMAHQIDAEFITAYCRGAEAAGIPLLVVGHGNGLGASSLHLGTSLLSDHDMLCTAKKQLRRTHLAAFLIPGFGTIQKDIIPAIEDGIDAIMIASHCTEANVTRQHIQFGRAKNLLTYGVLMMSHMVDADTLLQQALYMESYGAQSVILMDSAGAYTQDDVQRNVQSLVSGLSIPVGFHSHNNLGLAVANAIEAVKSGATIVDGTSRGLGAGAGNCPLEAVVAVLQKTGYETGLSLYPMLDNGDLVSKRVGKLPEINSVTLVSGVAGVFSGFAPLVIKAAQQYGVDVRDILIELGKRRVVGGQEDMIIEVAQYIKQKKAGLPEDFQLESLT